MNRTKMILAAAAAILGLSVPWMSSPVSAGPLDPPAGPVQSTLKTLTQVEPRRAINATNTPGDGDSVFRITASGSYYLTGDIVATSGKHGIEVSADHVTIDLMGLRITGTPGSRNGIDAFEAVNLRIRNGFIQGVEGTGIRVNEVLLSAQETVIDDVHVTGCGGDGIFVSDATIIRGCVVSDNVGAGIVAEDSCLIERCRVVGNGGGGLLAGFAATIIGSSFESCMGVGVSVGPGSVIRDCLARLNTGDGLVVETGSTVEGCVARENGGNGIAMSNSSVVTGSIASSNGGNGILGVGDCLIRGNTCEGNGVNSTFAGIRVTSSDNRIDGNTCIGNATGIRVTSSGNFIARNVVSNPTSSLNWDIVSGNKCLVVKATPAGAINGNAGGVDPGSSSPNANFTY